MTSASTDSPLAVWHGELRWGPRFVSATDGRAQWELVLGLTPKTTEDPTVLIVRMDHEPRLRVDDQVVLLGRLVPSPPWDPQLEEPDPPRRVRDVAGLRIRRRRWVSFRVHRARYRARRRRELGLRR